VKKILVVMLFLFLFGCRNITSNIDPILNTTLSTITPTISTTITTTTDIDSNFPMETLDGSGGGIILFENEANRDYNFEIYVMNADGTSLLKLTDNSSYDGGPSFSPDLTKFIFSSNRSGHMQLYLYDFDAFLRGNDISVIQITETSNNYYPAWAPDNSAIVFVSDRDGDFRIYIMNTDGTNEELYIDLENACFPSWSSDSSKLLFSARVNGSNEIYTMDRSGGNLTRLTFNDTDDQFAKYSPDGEYIVFSRSNLNSSYDIYVMDKNGNNEVLLISHYGLDELPIWSPDGTKIVFRSRISGSDQITMMNRDGSNSVALTNLRGMSIPYDWKMR
jgi:Tol biopolymer transport system component